MDGLIVMHTPLMTWRPMTGLAGAGQGLRTTPVSGNQLSTQGPELGGAAGPLVPGAVWVALDVVLELLDWPGDVWPGLFPQPASKKAAARNAINFFIFLLV